MILSPARLSRARDEIFRDRCPARRSFAFSQAFPLAFCPGSATLSPGPGDGVAPERPFSLS